MDATHFGRTPTTLADAILSELAALQMDGDVGVCRTIGRIRGDSPEDIKAALHGGAPAVLLHYEGFSSIPAEQATDGQLEQDTLTFKLLCVSGQISAVRLRQDGEGERNPDLVNADRVGVEQLQDWSRYLALRALHAAKARRVRTLRGTQSYRITAEHFIGAVYLSCSREVDIYDDAPANLLQQLGIVHDPTNPTGDWWLPDNTTPISDWPPPGVDGGVTDL